MCCLLLNWNFSARVGTWGVTEVSSVLCECSECIVHKGCFGFLLFVQEHFLFFSEKSETVADGDTHMAKGTGFFVEYRISKSPHRSRHCRTYFH